MTGGMFVLVLMLQAARPRGNQTASPNMGKWHKGSHTVLFYSVVGIYFCIVYSNLEAGVFSRILECVYYYK